MVFLFQRIFTHYRLQIYKRLNQVLDNELVLSYGQQAKNGFLLDIGEDSLPFKTVRVKNLWFSGESAVWRNFWKPFQIFGRPDAVIMEHSLRILFLFPLYLCCKFKKTPFILWGHGGSRKRSVSESPAAKDIIHRWIIQRANAYICYADGIKEELSKITEPQKLFVARNTLDTEALLSIRSKLEKEGKKSVKRRLGLARHYYMCFIGRLLADKEVDYLIDVYELVKQRCLDTGLLIIGDGPVRMALEDYASSKELADVHFLGSIADWENSGPYLFISDVMVMPGYVGLSVNHAFCFGLPVITQQTGEDGPFHSPEVEYIEDGGTGFICKNGDKGEMVQAIVSVFENQAYFKEKTLRYCEDNLSIEAMIKGITEAVDFAIRQRRSI